MSRENLEIVRRAYAAWNRDDLDAALSLIHPDAKWAVGNPDLFPGLNDLYRGHEEIREWWEAVGAV